MATGNQWSEVLSASQLDAAYALTASLDPAFAARDRKFWETRTVAQLNALRAGAWDANQPTSFQMARSYLALNEVAA